MQHGNAVSPDAKTEDTACVFCQLDKIASRIIKETPNFRVVADHAPLAEGHLLIIPKDHYACYGAVPTKLDEELFALKSEIQQFFNQFYAPVVFWEHGVFRQTVFHAHLHCFPFGKIQYNLSDALHNCVISSQDEIRAWYTTHGHYFYMEDARHALLFAPKMDHYVRILQEVLWPGASARTGHTAWRSQQQRLEEGETLIKTMTTKWRTFEQQGANNANESYTR